ncbi:phosphatidylserine/phosphatidylglycerophosphate/cardiolipin synthase [secondary endosymbiont of Heteropsylla cubana]|uniref:Cardiolipin synthase A n=1 Tax=secondary endosymbiont of Heteropsylla cubana TaxID=134287 RepID=J3TYP0_9ENTR|nr:cardiolipin synthase [secondary endosymbiont of Heteropsylla cubana]AFP85530.1 phosphatidylserine/phosphatidylglycerophosphate/cardiolipin synthase [secondary endosymbiont of Heteropsylla cubana]
MITLYFVINCLLLFGYWLLIAGVTLRVMMKRRAVPSAMAWLLVIYIFPLVGVIAYLLFGERNLGKRRAERSKMLWHFTAKWMKNLQDYPYIFSNKHSKSAQSLFQLCEHRQGMSGIRGEKIDLLTSSDDALLALIHDIKQAKKNIEIVFYIWKTGGLVDKVAEALIEAARRGVFCRLMLDSRGSVDFFRSNYPSLMRDAGVRIVEALHVNLLRVFLRRMDLRQHRKMVLIDNHVAYTGSMNMVDPRFFKKNAGVGQWIDILARMEGAVVIAMGIIFSFDWEIETGERIRLKPPNVHVIPFEENAEYVVHVIPSGPGFPEGFIHQVLLTSIYSARTTLVMTTPYLVPSDDLLHAICTAAQRGVEVHIIIPRHNDSMLVGWASRAFFCELLEAGVFIHQFLGGFLHTKSILVDGQLSLIGTVNLDMRSLWLNFEIMLVIDDENFGKDLARIQEKYISCSRLVSLHLWSMRPYWQRIIERLFYFFSPLL